MSESKVEKACCKYAAKRGVLPIKLAGGVTGEPDRIFLLPQGIFWLVEFKRPGGPLRPRQIERHRELAEMGIYVTVVDNREMFTILLDMYLEATA